jgi:antitoxin (DNA-binding transcriptional repressor) of toxin-antitoxin stability system
MTMIMVNINEAKARLSEFLAAAERGERVVICKRNQQVAELKAIPAQPAAGPRPIGGTSGIVVPPAFFEPLPDDLLQAFAGQGTTRPLPSRAAERRDRSYGDERPRAKARRQRR